MEAQELARLSGTGDSMLDSAVVESKHWFDNEEEAETSSLQERTKELERELMLKAVEVDNLQEMLDRLECLVSRN